MQGVGECPPSPAELPGAANGGISPLRMIGSAVFEHGGSWLDQAVDYQAANRDLPARPFTRTGLRGVYTPEATYLAWSDLRSVGLDDPTARQLDARAATARSRPRARRQRIRPVELPDPARVLEDAAVSPFGVPGGLDCGMDGVTETAHDEESHVRWRYVQHGIGSA